MFSGSWKSHSEVLLSSVCQLQFPSMLPNLKLKTYEALGGGWSEQEGNRISPQLFFFLSPNPEGQSAAVVRVDLWGGVERGVHLSPASLMPGLPSWVVSAATQCTHPVWGLSGLHSPPAVPLPPGAVAIVSLWWPFSSRTGENPCVMWPRVQVLGCKGSKCKAASTGRAR